MEPFSTCLSCTILCGSETTGTPFILHLNRHGISYTTLLSIIYIFLLAIEFSWMVIGTIFINRYAEEVTLANFYMVAWIYLILGWLEILFLPALFLFCTLQSPL